MAEMQMDDARIKAELAAREAEMYRSMRTAQTDDPWEHRSEGMRCRTCMWYVAKKGGGREIGRCRRHSPTMSGYPAVYPGDWCGDHKVNEAALGHYDTERVA